MVDTKQYIIDKYKIEVGNQYFIQIPEIIGGAGLSKLFAELNLNLGVEIGTDQGEFAEVLLKDNPKLVLHCVDPWRAVAYEKGQQPESNEDQTFFDKRYKETQEKLKPFINCTIFRMASMEIVDRFPDNFFDFVYIDGNHDFLNVTLDIHYWYKKVKPGGILAGHDFVRYPSRKFNHVQKVVQAYTTSYHLLPVFLVTPTNDGLKRDRYRSWFLVK